uniref:Uncharacterized protein n=1 Tax=uncultured marine thaumarchaeote KM3_72_D04 TaxID=1456262 RepID=A0A075HHZ2_9ARCH|nr:hypothetical protein [uncultured marine thaumarchaeote KM3_72_D04]
MNRDSRLNLLMKTICFNPNCSISDLKKILHGSMGSNELIEAVHDLEDTNEIVIDKSGLTVNKLPKWKIKIRDRRTFQNIQDLEQGIIGYQKEIDLILKRFKIEGIVKNQMTDYYDNKGKLRRHKAKALNPKIEGLFKIVNFYFDTLFISSATLSSNLALGHISKYYNNQIRELEKNVIEFILETKVRIENIQFRKTGPYEAHLINQWFRLEHHWLGPIMEKLPGDKNMFDKA